MVQKSTDRPESARGNVAAIKAYRLRRSILKRNAVSPGESHAGVDQHDDGLASTLSVGGLTRIALQIRIKTLQEFAATATAIAFSELNRQTPSRIGDMIAVWAAPNRKCVRLQCLDRPT